MTSSTCDCCGYLKTIASLDGNYVMHPDPNTYKSEWVAIIKVGCGGCDKWDNVPLARHEVQELISQMVLKGMA